MESNDHDLLIELRTEVKGVRSDVRELKDNMAERVSDLEKGKVGEAEVLRLKKEADAIHDDHEKRIRRLEWSVALVTGGLVIIQFVLNYIK